MRITTIIFAVLIVGGGVALLRVMGDLAAKPPEVTKRETEFLVRTTIAQPDSFSPFLSIIGTVEAHDDADIVSPIESSVFELNYEEGDQVLKGSSVVVLDTRDLLLQIEAQQASLDDIQAQIDSLLFDRKVEVQRLNELNHLKDLASAELDRTVKLNERGVVSTGAVDQAETLVSQRGLEILAQRQKINALELSEQRLDANLRGNRAQLGLLRLTLERARLEAPWDGVVREILTSAGTDVQRGNLLARIYDPTTVRLRAAVPTSIAAYGTQLSGVLTTSNGVEHELELISISPEAKKGRGSTSALFALPPGAWLLGSALELDLVLPAIENSFALPADALYGGSRIYVLDKSADEQQRARAVECSNLGQTRAQSRQMILLDCEGLASGDQVVINRIPNLVSGSKLRVEGAPLEAKGKPETGTTS